MLIREQRVVLKYLLMVGVLMILVTWLASRSFAQEVAQQKAVTGPTASKSGTPAPVMTEYRGVKIGLTAGNVRDLIDEKPQSEDDSGYFYVFSDSETAQILLDDNKRVRAIAVTYLGKDANAPTYEAVFGKDMPVKHSADGRVYNMVTYPKSGFWVAYSSLGPEAKNPLISITIQSTDN